MLFFTYPLIHCLSAQEVDITSDKLDYDRQKGIAIFSGNVKLAVKDIAMTCDNATSNLVKKDIWLENTTFSTCNLENPHYRFWSKKVHLVANKKITATNVIFYLDDVPVFILPYYYKSLRDKKLEIDIRQGYNQRDDYYAKTTIKYPFTDYLYSKLYLDYFSYKGWGTGTELNYNFERDEWGGDAGQKTQGSIYGYHIFEQDNGIRRWNLQVYHWQDLSYNWTAQINSNLASDESFNNYYTRDWIRVNRAVDSSIAFTKTAKQSTTRILFSRYDVFDSTESKYILTNMVVPSFAYTTTQIKLKNLPLYYKWGLNADKTWSRITDFFLTKGNANFDISSPLRLTRIITLTPATGLTQYWQDRINKQNPADIYKSVHRTDMNLNLRPVYFLSQDFGHHFEQEIEKPHDEYHGVLVNKLRTTQSAYFDNLTLRIWTGFNIRRKLHEKIGGLDDIKQRLDGITSEIDFYTYNILNIYYKNDYSILYEKPNSVQLNTSVKAGRGEGDVYLKNGFSYNRLQPQKLTFFNELGLKPTRNWQLSYKMQSSFNYDSSADVKYYLSNFKFYEYQFSIYRDLHCWEAVFSYLERAPLTTTEEIYYEVRFNIRIKPTVTDKQKEQQDTDWERKWYPWR